MHVFRPARSNARENALARSVQPSDARRSRNSPDGLDVLRVRRDRLLEDPIAIHVAAGQVHRVAWRERLQHGGDELALAASRWPASIEADVSASRIRSSGCLVGQQVAVVLCVFRGRRQQQHEIAVVAAAVWNQRQLRLLSLQLGNHLEIARRACIPAPSNSTWAECSVWAVRTACVGEATFFKRHDRVDLHVDGQAREADAA